MNRHDDRDLRRLRLGRAIDRHRRARGLTQDELEQMTGISQSSISQWQRGQRGVPNIEHIAQLEEALGLPVGALLIEGGYVNVPTTTFDLLPVDPLLTPERRELVLDLYVAQIARSERELGAHAAELDAAASLPVEVPRRSSSGARATSSAAATTRRRSAANS